MSNDKLPAPNDECLKCGQTFEKHSGVGNYCRHAENPFIWDTINRFTPKPLQVEGPTRDGCFIHGNDYEPDCLICTHPSTHKPGAGAEATGKPPERFTIEEVVDAIKKHWLQEFEDLEDHSYEYRDGYFVAGFVRDALENSNKKA